MNEQHLYAEHFEFTERPFTLVPDPEFLFWSEQHKQAFAVLEFGIMSRAPITLITGEIGSGKTTLLQQLLRQLDDAFTVGLVSNAQGGRGELLQWVLNSLDIGFAENDPYVILFQKLQNFIIEEYANGRHVVLIVDEAQNLNSEVLEELRMLTNINSNKDELFQLILAGQPELREMIMKPSMRQLAQRVAASYHLEGMDAKTVKEYIKHRLTTVGGTGNEFSPNACGEIHKQTNGIPRLVNQLCDLCLLYTWGNGHKSVGLSVVRKVISDGVFFASQAGAVPKDD